MAPGPEKAAVPAALEKEHAQLGRVHGVLPVFFFGD
jgi:hypothetical protein